MRILFTKLAKKDLSEIVEYYADNDNRMAGRKIRAKIITKAMTLGSFPNLGKIEELYTKKYDKEFRFLICDDHKIIYHIDEENVVISIVKVFDTRQNPDKL